MAKKGQSALNQARIYIGTTDSPTQPKYKGGKKRSDAPTPYECSRDANSAYYWLTAEDETAYARRPFDLSNKELARPTWSAASDGSMNHFCIRAFGFRGWRNAMERNDFNSGPRWLCLTWTSLFHRSFNLRCFFFFYSFFFFFGFFLGVVWLLWR